MKQTLQRRWTRLVSIMILSLGLCACTVHLIAPYNAKLVQTLNHVQSQLNLILLDTQLQLGTPKAQYKHYRLQYDMIRVKLIVLLSELKIIPHSDTVFKQVSILRQSVLQTIKLHKRGFKNIAEILLLQSTLNDEFTAIYQLEYAKQTYLTE